MSTQLEVHRESLARSVVGANGAPSRAALDRLGHRVAETLNRLFELLPPKARTIRAAAEFLGVDRNVCQRTMSAIRADRSGLEVLSELPGLPQIRALLNGAQRHLPARRLTSARAALKALEQAVHEAGGTPIRFKRVIDALNSGGRGANEHGSGVAGRQRLHEVALTIAGADLALRFVTTVVHPVDAAARQIQIGYANGFIGQEIRKGAMPATSTVLLATPRVFPSPPSAETASALPALGPGPELLEPFCSERVSLAHEPRDAQGGVPFSIDASALPNGARVDVVTGGKHPPMNSPVHAADDPTLGHMVTLRAPARRLLLDVFVHRTVAVNCLVWGGAFVFNPLLAEVHGAAKLCWHCELPDQPRLELLGEGARYIATDAWDRYAAMVLHLFGRLGWDIDDMVGYRMDVQYPIWGMIYRTELDGQAAQRRPE